MPKATRPTTTADASSPPHTAVIIAFPEPPIPWTHERAVNRAIREVETISAEDLIQIATIAMMMEANVATVDEQMKLAMKAMLCLCRALEAARFPVLRGGAA